MGDQQEYGSFAGFQGHIRTASLGGDKDAVTYRSGNDTLAASWDNFAVNGTDAYAAAVEQQIWQDTTLSQMGLGRRLEKGGAVVERGAVQGVDPLLLQTFPKQQIYVCINPVPGYKAYRFRTPDGVRIVADGLCSMGQWAVKAGREIDVRYAAFQLKPPHMPKPDQCATLLFVSGTRGKPKVVLNTEDVTAALKAWKQDGADGWLVPLTGKLPEDEKIAARLKAANSDLGP